MVQVTFQSRAIGDGRNIKVHRDLENRSGLDQHSATDGFPSDPLPSASTALLRGLRRMCPHCGLGPLFKGWGGAIDRCPRCGLVYERNPGDTWAFTIVGDRLPMAAAIVYFGVGAMNRAAAV